jgi:hypothetical protein
MRGERTLRIMLGLGEAVGHSNAPNIPIPPKGDEPTSAVLPTLKAGDEDAIGDALRSAWDDPKALSRLIAKGVSDGRVEEVELASKRLVELTPRAEKAICLRAVVLMRLQGRRTDEAIQTLSTFAHEHGETANTLLTLAKAYELRGNTAGRDSAVARAAAADPNHERALIWLCSLAEATGAAGAAGEAAHPQLPVLERLANRSGAWRPQLLIAKHLLESGEIDPALEQSSCALAKVDEDPRVLSATLDTFWQSPHLGEAIAQLADVYDPERHGHSFGARLAKGMATVGRGRDAQALLARLRRHEPDSGSPPRRPRDVREAPETRPVGRQKQPEKTIPASAKAAAVEGPLRTVSVAAPLWTRGLDEPTWLLPEPSADAPRLVFSVFADDEDGEQTRERSALAIPLYLLEVCRTVARLPTLLLVPWAPGRGPVISAARPPRQSMLSATPGATECDVSLIGSLRHCEDFHHLELDVFRTASSQLLASEHITARTPGELAAQAATHLLEIVQGLGGDEFSSATLDSRPPQGAMGPYLSSLGRLLDQSGAAAGVLPPGTNADVSEHLEHYASVAEAWPNASQPRICMLAGVLLAIRCGLDVPRTRLEQLENWIIDSPSDDALSRLHPLLLLKTGDTAGFDGLLRELRPTATGAYASWLASLAAAANYAART